MKPYPLTVTRPRCLCLVDDEPGCCLVEIICKAENTSSLFGCTVVNLATFPETTVNLAVCSFSRCGF